MNRREFLVRVGGTLVAVPMVLEAVSCGSDNGPAAPAPTDRFSVGNSEVNPQHTHTFIVLCADLASPPTFKNYTATGSGHTHTVRLENSDLVTVAGGGEVVKNTNDLHPHQWTIRKPSGVC